MTTMKMLGWSVKEGEEKREETRGKKGHMYIETLIFKKL